MSIDPLPQLAPHYYLDNFHIALAWVRDRYIDLLNTEELDFITRFETLERPSQALLVRLVMRKGVHFRASKLNYEEIGDIPRAATPLFELGWLRTDAEIDLGTLFALLRKDEILTQIPAAPLLRAATKSAMFEALNSDDTASKQFSDWCPGTQDTLYSLTINALCDCLRLLFFGNLNQTWAEFVLADLGIFRYESVDIPPESRGFRCREDVDQYLHLRECRDAFEAGMTIVEVRQMIGEFASTNPFLQMRHGKLIFSLARQLEREEAFDTALQLYSDCSYAGARQRRIRILEKQGLYLEAHTLAKTAQTAPESDSELQLVERALTRLERKLGQPAKRRRALQTASRLDLLLPRPEHESVEHAVCNHLATPDAPVYYVENALISSLFGLLCWEAIFAPVPGAFFHPFHNGPVDLHDSDFHQRRAQLFDTCFAHLRTGSYPQQIRDNYAAKYGIQSPFVYWGLSPEVLDQALNCLPAEHLQLWFQRLLLDIRANRSGMPDLIQFWPQEKRYRMIEVKGPGDRLQDNQRRWITFCMQHGMPVDVCHVQWTGA